MTMAIAGRRLIPQEEAGPGEAEDLLHRQSLHGWNYYDAAYASGAPFVPATQQEWPEHLA